MPAGSRGGGELDHGAVIVGGLIGVLNYRTAAGGARGEGVGVDGEVGDGRFVGVHGDVNRTGTAGDVPGPLHEVPAGVGGGRQPDHGAMVVDNLRRALPHRAAADLAGREGVSVDGEHGRYRLIAVHGQRSRVSRPSQVPGPLHEVTAGGRRRRELDGRPVIVSGLIGDPGHRAAAGDVHRQGVSVEGEHRRDRLGLVHGQGSRIGRTGEIAGPLHEVVPDARRGGQLDHRTVVVQSLVRD